jgi:hypothetical protein
MLLNIHGVVEQKQPFVVLRKVCQIKTVSLNPTILVIICVGTAVANLQTGGCASKENCSVPVSKRLL